MVNAKEKNGRYTRLCQKEHCQGAFVDVRCVEKETDLTGNNFCVGATIKWVTVPSADFE